MVPRVPSCRAKGAGGWVQGWVGGGGCRGGVQGWGGCGGRVPSCRAGARAEARMPSCKTRPGWLQGQGRGQGQGQRVQTNTGASQIREEPSVGLGRRPGRKHEQLPPPPAAAPQLAPLGPRLPPSRAGPWSHGAGATSGAPLIASTSRPLGGEAPHPTPPRWVAGHSCNQGLASILDAAKLAFLFRSSMPRLASSGNLDTAALVLFT